MKQALFTFGFLLAFFVGWGQSEAPSDSIMILVWPPQQLPEALVEGVSAQEPLNAMTSPHAVSTLLPLEINQVATPAVGDALEAVVGVDVRSRGPLGVQSDLGVRGGSFEQTALYVDGIRWSAPQTGHHLMNLPFDPALLGGLEVVRGGTGAFAGVGAFAGSVHLSLRTLAPAAFTQVALEGGQNGWMRAAMSGMWATPDFTHRASVSHSETSGYMENTDAMITRATWIGDWRDKHEGLWRALIGLEEKSFGAQSFYTAAYPHQFESTGSTVAQVTWRRQRAWSSFAGAHLRYHRDRFELYREGAAWYAPTPDGYFVREAFEGEPADTAASWYGGANQHRSLTTGMTLRTAKTHGFGRITIGADVRMEAVRSNVLGVMRDSSSVRPLGQERLNLDAFVSERWQNPAGTARVSATLGLNANSQFGARLLPACDAAWVLNPKWSAFASAGRSVRHPSYTDLYYQGGARGRADLQPEKSDQVELGMRWQKTRQSDFVSRPAQFIRLEMAGWMRWGSDLIDWVLLPGSEEFEAANLTSTKHEGLELSALYQHPNRGDLGFQSLRVSYAMTHAEATDTSIVSSYALDILRNKADVLATVVLPVGLVMELRGTYQDRQGSFAGVDYEPFTVLGMGLSHWSLGRRLRTFVRIDNVLNANYVDFGNVLQPGRWWRAGVIWRAER